MHLHWHAVVLAGTSPSSLTALAVKPILLIYLLNVQLCVSLSQILQIVADGQ